MNRFKKMLCILLSICMVSLPMTASLISVSATDINSLEKKLYDLEQENKKYQDILEKTQSDIRDKEKYSKALVNKIKVLDDKIEVSRQKIEELSNSIKQK